MNNFKKAWAKAIRKGEAPYGEYSYEELFEFLDDLYQDERIENDYMAGDQLQAFFNLDINVARAIVLRYREAKARKK